ncbi:MAG: hypothetical protein NTV34_20455, partial [Proteobacteria bacterium]|nr:hypothetical protein [Pseudomonadota bacterium]
GSYQWDSVLQIFLARYGREVSASWRPSGETPSQPDFAYLDSRKVSSDIKYLLPLTNLSEENNLVILGIRIRSGFDAASYQYRKALLILYVDPETGVKKTAVFTDPTSQTGEILKPALFILASKAQLPASNQDTLVSNLITAADTIQAISQGEPPIADVPFHSFVSSTFRYVDGVSLEGSPSPYGIPLTSLTHDQDFEKVRDILTKALSYDADSLDSRLRIISLDEFQQLVQAMRVGL